MGNYTIHAPRSWYNICKADIILDRMPSPARRKSAATAPEPGNDTGRKARREENEETRRPLLIRSDKQGTQTINVFRVNFSRKPRRTGGAI